MSPDLSQNPVRGDNGTPRRVGLYIFRGVRAPLKVRKAPLKLATHIWVPITGRLPKKPRTCRVNLRRVDSHKHIQLYGHIWVFHFLLSEALNNKSTSPADQPCQHQVPTHLNKAPIFRIENRLYTHSLLYQQESTNAKVIPRLSTLIIMIISTSPPPLNNLIPSP